MLRRYKSKDRNGDPRIVYVPRVLGFYLERVDNLMIYRLTSDPHIATRLSTKAKAKAVRREYLRWIFLRK
jgi:hypothetical protein